jgi:hypothetical protein
MLRVSQADAREKSRNDVSLGGIRRFPDFVTKLEVARNSSVRRRFPDFDIEFVHPLPRDHIGSVLNDSNVRTIRTF